MSEDKKKEIREKIADTKASMNKKLDEEKNEKVKIIEAKKKAAPPQMLQFELILSITDPEITKCGQALEKLKPGTPKITDWKLIDGKVTVKLLHSNKEKLIKSIEDTKAFSIDQLEESKLKNPPAKPYGGYFRKAVQPHFQYNKRFKK